MSPDTLNISNTDRVLNITAKVKDKNSGVNYLAVELAAKNGGAEIYTTLSLVSGNANNGTWKGKIVIPQGSAAGTWFINYLSINDKAGNNQFYSTAEFAQLGFENTIEVIYK